MNVTPRPWTDDGRGSLRGADGRQVDVWGLGVAHAQRSPETEANAAFIVKAVNAHDKLKDALTALLSECVLAGFDHKSGYGWPKALSDAAEALRAAGEQV